jgi:hypothetical protein
MNETERLQQELRMWLRQLEAAEDHADAVHYNRALAEIDRVQDELNRLYAE